MCENKELQEYNSVVNANNSSNILVSPIKTIKVAHESQLVISETSAINATDKQVKLSNEQDFFLSEDLILNAEPPADLELSIPSNNLIDINVDGKKFS